jgi:uncharacterized protein YbaP (TraB family)
MLRLIHRLAVLAVMALSLTAAPALAEPALWAIRDADSTIYLFGTVHYLRPATPWHSAKVDAALAASRELILEVPLDDPAATASMAGAVQSLGMDPRGPLSTKISAKDRARLTAAARSLGLDAQLMEPMQPWFAALTLSVVPAIRAGYDPQAGVELALSKIARSHGESVSGLETVLQQLHFMADLPRPVQVEFLSSTLDEVDDSVRQIDALVDAWAAGDLKTLEKEFVGETRDKYPDLYQVLLVRRNQAWADTLKAKLAGSGVSFVAVGAGHLVGPDSVQAQLKKRGVTVERLN